MAEVLVLALSFPSVVFTALLGVVLVYWLFVMIGAVDLGQGDGALEGSVKGALEGSAKGALEGSLKGALEAGGDGGDTIEVGDGHEPSGLAALLSALGLRKIPVTVSVSLLVTFGWMTSMICMQLVTRSAPALATGWVKALVLLLSALAALPLSALVARPLATVFVARHAPSRADLVGKTCVVRTGSVTHRFGEALLEDGGAGLVVRIRVDGERSLKRGDQALIVEWDAGRDAFLVEPMSEIMQARK